MTEPTETFKFIIPGHCIVGGRVDPHHFDGDETLDGASYILTEYEDDDVRERYGYDNPVEAFEMFLEMTLTWVELEAIRPSAPLDNLDPGVMCAFSIPEYQIVAECTGPGHPDGTHVVTEYVDGHVAERYAFDSDPVTMYELFLNRVEEQIAAEKAGVGARQDINMLTVVGAML